MNNIHGVGGLYKKGSHRLSSSIDKIADYIYVFDNKI
jgi:hypothetical protein